MGVVPLVFDDRDDKKITELILYQKLQTVKKQEGISVECQPPACRQSMLHSEKV